jgi:hypothetical protein
MTDTKASNTEASPSITLTDEALASLPVYMSMVREARGHAELRGAALCRGAGIEKSAVGPPVVCDKTAT